MSSPAATHQYCSILSSQAGEVLSGTATHVETFLLLESMESWGRDAIESVQNESVQAYLRELLGNFPTTKLLLIRSPFRAYGSGPRFFVARSHEKHPILYQFHLGDERDLLELDLASLVSNKSGSAELERYDLHRMNTPLYLVCTHGRRDACCAKFGLPIYNELLEQAGENCWQSSHMGGHRFAPNLLVIPHGLLYARLGSQDALDVLQATGRGEMLLDPLRGRTAYPQVAQAAEIYLRKLLEEKQTDAFNLEGVLDNGKSEHLVSFADARNGQRYRFAVRIVDGEERVYESCFLEKTSAMRQYAVTRIE